MPKKIEKKKIEETESPKKISLQEFEKKVVELAEKGLTSERIGEELRKEKIHPREYGKKISHILKERKMYVNADLKNMENKLARINKHYEKNKQDKRAMREKNRVFSQYRIAKNYFEKN